VCIVDNQQDTISNPNSNQNPNTTTKQHAIVNIQLNIVTCATYPDKFIRDNVVASFVLVSIVISSGLGRLAAWHLPDGSVDPRARWAATSNVAGASGTEQGAQGPLAGEEEL